MGIKPPYDVSSGSPIASKPMSFGTLGPKMSRSSNPILGFLLLPAEDRNGGLVSESATARLAEMVDLPTPPLPDETQTTCLTFGIRRGCGVPEPLRGMVGGMRWLFRGRPSGFSCERDVLLIDIVRARDGVRRGWTNIPLKCTAGPERHPAA